MQHTLLHSYTDWKERLCVPHDLLAIIMNNDD